MGKRICTVLVIIGVVIGVLATRTTLYAQGDPKNVQVHKDKSITDLRAYMKTVADGIGVKCNFCHNMKDYSSDEIKYKRIAREMMKMVNEVNTQIAAINRNVMNKREIQTVTCYTCHQGDLAVVSNEE